MNSNLSKIFIYNFKLENLFSTNYTKCKSGLCNFCVFNVSL